MANVLAPRIGGVTTAIAAAPEADVAVCLVGTDRRLDRARENGSGGFEEQDTGSKVIHRRGLELEDGSA